jgi:DNA polymerase III epsilon subunit-like protein
MDFCNFTNKKDVFVAKRILVVYRGSYYSKMKVLVFDTETTGLPKARTKAVQQKDIWPHIVSISWLVLDSDTNENITQKSYIIKPDGWEIPTETTMIHGISTEFALQNGVPLKHALDDFLSTPHDMIVAHNLDFDENVVVNAVKWDLGESNYIGFVKPRYCTMQLSADMCRLPSKFGRGYKPPKLSELYENVFREKPILAQLHGSMYDAKILADILRASPVLRAKIGLRVAPQVNNNENSANVSKVLYL